MFQCVARRMMAYKTDGGIESTAEPAFWAQVCMEIVSMGTCRQQEAYLAAQHNGRSNPTRMTCAQCCLDKAFEGALNHVDTPCMLLWNEFGYEANAETTGWFRAVLICSSNTN